MAEKVVPPELGAKSFSCPHCGAIAHQTWYVVYLDTYTKDAGPWMPTAKVIADIEADKSLGESRASIVEFGKRKMTKELFVEPHKDSCYSRSELINLHISQCFSCEAYALWHADQIIYPATNYEVEANADMPADVKTDFIEASGIVDKSPRGGAAALLRLCIEKLMSHLGEKGKNIDADIGSSVKKGLDPKIQKALDVVRVIGNNAVHPGQIDLKDDKATAMRLFTLVNLIVETTISLPKQLNEMYAKLPQGALDAIEKRDMPKTPASGAGP